MFRVLIQGGFINFLVFFCIIQTDNFPFWRLKMEKYVGNINDLVEVTLTAEGQAILERYAENCAANLPKNMQPGAKINFMRMNSLPLWRLMEIFGPHHIPGGPQLFVENQIIIKRRDWPLWLNHGKARPFPVEPFLFPYTTHKLSLSVFHALLGRLITV